MKKIYRKIKLKGALSVRKSFVIKIVICLSLACTTSQAFCQDEDMNDNDIERLVKYTGLIDGGIRNVESVGSNDVVSSGLLGFRFDNERNVFRISISAFSSFDSIKSNQHYDFARNILNTGMTQPGLSSISVEYQNRFFSDKGFQFYEAKKEFLSKKRSTARRAAFKALLTRNSISGLNWWQKHAGLRLYGEIANSNWTSGDILPSTNVSIAMFGGNITYFSQVTNSESFNVSITSGVGVTGRLLFNDISNNKYDNARLATVGTKQKLFVGPELYTSFNVNNIYARFSLPIFFGKTQIDGLTSGQPIFSIGLTADLGHIEREETTISDLVDPDVNSGLIPQSGD